ncbi:MAG: radical SAM protein [Candidatus Omnitrophica bacterium]|nr:radical SAM protein [Candidatus Omnitrophota bacterium]
MLITKKRKAKIFKFFRFSNLPFLPFILGIEPGNACNLNCPLCPTGRREEGLEKGFMEFCLFKKIFDDLEDYLSCINLYSWGEPLLNKDLIKMITYAKDINKGIRITTSTNLNITNKEMLKGLVVSGIDEIIVSCDGASEASYSKYRVGGDFKLVMDNLRYLAQTKTAFKAKTAVIWNFLVFRHNEHEIEMARKTAQAIGVLFRIGLMRTSMKDEILKPHQDAISKDKDWIPDNPEYSAYDKEKCVTKKIIKTCRKPWQEISINWDGKVFPCCAVYGGKYNFGNVKEKSIREVWNNRFYLEARKQILNKRAGATTICGICRNNGFMHM